MFSIYYSSSFIIRIGRFLFALSILLSCSEIIRETLPPIQTGRQVFSFSSIRICPPLILFNSRLISYAGGSIPFSNLSITSLLTIDFPCLILSIIFGAALPTILSNFSSCNFMLISPKCITLSGLHLFPGIKVRPLLLLLSDSQISFASGVDQSILLPLLQRLFSSHPRVSNINSPISGFIG